MKTRAENPDTRVSGASRQGIPALREIVEERKDKVIESLSVSFARDRLPLEEYERLVEYINKIESERELTIVEKMAAEYGKSETPDGTKSKSPGVNAGFGADDDDEPGFFDRSHTGINFTLLSSRNFSGPVRADSQFISILGSGHIKIRRADLEKRRTAIEVVAILGDCIISVESGIRVINKAIPVLGGSRITRKAAKLAGNGELELCVSGVALLGNITVKPLAE